MQERVVSRAAMCSPPCSHTLSQQQTSSSARNARQAFSCQGKRKPAAGLAYCYWLVSCCFC
jgi:hypothetical protein